MDFKTGGQKVILRLVEAYGFSTRQMLCDHLGVSKSTLATRFMRDIFPAEWVIQCALETGVQLKWLTTGDGPMFVEHKDDILEIPKQKIIEGKLAPSGHYLFDKTVLSSMSGELEAFVEKNKIHIAGKEFNGIQDGTWLVEIEGEISIKEITKIPVKRIRVVGESSFECNLEEIVFLRKILGTFTHLN